MVRPDYCAVDHLQAGVATAAVVEGFEQQLPQAGQRPAPELAINRRPFAEMLVQVAPGNARPRNPENPIQNKAMIPRSSPAARTALDHEWLETRPFLVTHQTPDHSNLPKSYRESETTPFGNPFCQHSLALLWQICNFWDSLLIGSVIHGEPADGGWRWWMTGGTILRSG
jgi:hypothetical protein